MRILLIAAIVTGAFGGAEQRSTGAAPADEPRTIKASFNQPSYRPGDVAYLTVTSPVRGTTLRVFRCGPPARRARRNDTMSGVPVTETAAASRRVAIKLGDWPSGLYFARLEGSGGKLGFAPFVLRPRTLGESRVAVVHFRGYDQGFLWWLGLHDKDVDVLADDDFERIRNGAQLVRLYDLLVFSGHEEYVTAHMYDVVQSYRNRGGNLVFLSANNFYYRVERRGRRLYKIGHWSDVGRTGETLGGLVYVGWSKSQFRNRPYVVVGASNAHWFFRGTGLRNGSRWGVYGIEIDQRGAHPPRRDVVLARIKDAFGPGRSAEMTYYTTSRGARVFSAGVMNFGGSALFPTVSVMLENLWARLGRP